MKLQFEGYSYRFGWLSRLVTLVGVVVLMTLCFPLRWVSSTLAQETNCKMVLSEPSGTIWEGKASLGFSDFKAGDSKTCNTPYAVIERFSWKSHCSLLNLQCSWLIQQANLAQPLVLAINPKGVTIQSNRAELPGIVLEGAGSPWSSLHPRGKLKIQWNELTWDSFPKGSFEIQFLEMASRISPIQPLGSYALKIQIDRELRFELFTLQGPLLLNGKGFLQSGKLSFQGEAAASPESLDSLIGLLTIIGLRDGAVYRLNL